MQTNALPHTQCGQSMIEYSVVVIFGFILLTQGPMSGIVETVSNAIRNNYRGYSYTLSIADFPDSDNQTEYGKLLQNYELIDDHIARLADYPEDYQDAIEPHNIPNPPDISSIINDAINDIKNINFP